MVCSESETVTALSSVEDGLRDLQGVVDLDPELQMAVFEKLTDIATGIRTLQSRICYGGGVVVR